MKTSKSGGRADVAASGYDNVRDAVPRDELLHLVVEAGEVDAGEQVLSRTQEHGRDREVQLVDQSSLQILADDRHTATEPDVPRAGGIGGLPQRVIDIADEAELRAAFHGNRLARVTREHEHGDVIGRLVAPPPLPLVVGPLPAHRSEHVATEDPGADVAEAALHELVVDARRALGPLVATHLPECAGREHPFMQRLTSGAERFFAALPRPRAVTVY